MSRWKELQFIPVLPGSVRTEGCFASPSRIFTVIHLSTVRNRLRPLAWLRVGGSRPPNWIPGDSYGAQR